MKKLMLFFAFIGMMNVAHAQTSNGTIAPALNSTVVDVAAKAGFDSGDYVRVVSMAGSIVFEGKLDTTRGASFITSGYYFIQKIKDHQVVEVVRISVQP